MSNRSKPLRLRGLKYAITQSFTTLTAVEAFAASWIEIKLLKQLLRILMSKPLRLRGLKFLLQLYNHAFFSRSLCGFVD